MNKPTVYLDTNIISAYWHIGGNVSSAAQRFHTIEWWNVERKHFSAFVSVTTINELQAGRFRKQSECLKMVRRLPNLPLSREAKRVLEVWRKT